MRFSTGDILIREDGSRIKILNAIKQFNGSFYDYEYFNLKDLKYRSYSDLIEHYYKLDIKFIRKQKLIRLQKLNA